MRTASSGGQPRWTSAIASWRSTSKRAASATASSPAKPDPHELGGAPALHALELRLDDFVCRCIHPQCLRSHFRESAAEWISPSGGISRDYRPRIALLDRGSAQEVPNGGEEVRLRVDAVLGAELQELRPERGDEIDVHGRLAREFADDAGRAR